MNPYCTKTPKMLYLLLHLLMYIFHSYPLYYHPFFLSFLVSLFNIFSFYPPEKKSWNSRLTRKSRLHVSTWDKSTKTQAFLNECLQTDGQETQCSQFFYPPVFCSYQHLQASFSLSCGLQELSLMQKANKQLITVTCSRIIRSLSNKVMVTLLLQQSFPCLLYFFLPCSIYCFLVYFL